MTAHHFAVAATAGTTDAGSAVSSFANLPVTALSSASGCHNCGWALVSPRSSHVWPAENFRQSRAPRARIRLPRLRLAPNHGREDRVPPARPEDKVWRARAARPGLPKSTQAAATEASAEHPPSPADKQDTYAPSSTPCRSMTYAHAVARGQMDKSKTTQDEWMTRRHNHTSRRPVDPRKDGRCFRCLGGIILRGIVETPSSVTYA